MNGSVQDTFYVVGEIHTILAYSVPTQSASGISWWTAEHLLTPGSTWVLSAMSIWTTSTLFHVFGSKLCTCKKKKNKEGIIPMLGITQRCTLCSTCACQGGFPDAVKAAFSKPTLSSSAFLKENDLHNYSLVHPLNNFKPTQSLYFLCIQETWI